MLKNYIYIIFLGHTYIIYNSSRQMHIFRPQTNYVRAEKLNEKTTFGAANKYCQLQ